jgi:hypothetical protein
MKLASVADRNRGAGRLLLPCRTRRRFLRCRLLAAFGEVPVVFRGIDAMHIDQRFIDRRQRFGRFGPRRRRRADRCGCRGRARLCGLVAGSKQQAETGD